MRADDFMRSMGIEVVHFDATGEATARNTKGGAMSAALCLHDNYDEYFERCSCGMTGEEIHNEHCGECLKFDDEAGCWRCYKCDAWLDDVRAA